MRRTNVVDEQVFVEQVSLRFQPGHGLAHAAIQRLGAAERGAGGAAVGVGQLGDDVAVGIAQFVAGVQVALLVGVVLGLPGLEVAGRDERAPKGREAVALKSFPAGGLDGFEASGEILGQQAFVAQVEQVADQVVGLGRAGRGRSGRGGTWRASGGRGA